MGAEEAPDPRLVALGLVPPAAEKPTPAIADPAKAARVPEAPAAARVPEAPAARRGAPGVLDAPPPAPVSAVLPTVSRRAEEVPRTPHDVLFRQSVFFGRLRWRAALLELDPTGLWLTSRSRIFVPWSELRSVDDRRGKVRVTSATRTLEFAVGLDGVAEPALAAPLAAIIAETSSGTPARASSLHALELEAERLRQRFGEEDDPILPLIIGCAWVVGAVVLAILLRVVVVLPFRLGQPLPPGSFLLYPRISYADPPMLLAALAGGAAAAAGVVRLAGGGSVVAWARGSLRGWHRRGPLPLAIVRRACAFVALRPVIWAVVFALALVALFPAGRERAVIDEAGVHVRATLPFLDADRPWTTVDDALDVPVGADESPARRITIIRFSDGTSITTRGHDLFGPYGGSEYALYQFAKQRSAPPGSR